MAGPRWPLILTSPVLDTLLFHKPYGVLSQFSREPGSRWGCLADWIDWPDIYPAGRLDADSEGLLLLTADGRLQHRLTDPRWGHRRTYWVQVEGQANEESLGQLAQGVLIQGRRTLPADVIPISAPSVPERDPPIRTRRSIPTSWLEISLREGRNRQIRRMTASVGLPTLRLLRVSIDLGGAHVPLSLEGLAPGQWRLPSPCESEALAGLISQGGRLPLPVPGARGGSRRSGDVRPGRR